jgi:isoquinoline 1-oxidoreductase alpha subunit
MSTVGGKKVTTIEGLSPNSSHALQKAWIVEQVPQCGWREVRRIGAQRM